MTHVFKHPKYYKELRSIRNKSDQAISSEDHDGDRERAPGQGHKRQAARVKPQAAAGGKPQALRHKHQGSSRRYQAP